LGESQVENNSKILIHKTISSIELAFCKFAANQTQLTIQTDQLGFLPQSIDLMNGILTSLGLTPAKGVEFSVYTHFDLKNNENLNVFFQKVSPTNFWSDKISDYSQSKIALKQLKSSIYPSNISILISRCPKSDALIHINIDDKFEFDDKFLDTKTMKNILDKELKKSFDYCINLINQITDEFK